MKSISRMFIRELARHAGPRQAARPVANPSVAVLLCLMTASCAARTAGITTQWFAASVGDTQLGAAPKYGVHVGFPRQHMLGMEDVNLAVEFEYCELPDDQGNTWRQMSVGVPLISTRSDSDNMGAHFKAFKGWPLMSPQYARRYLGGVPRCAGWLLGINMRYLENGTTERLVIGPSLGYGGLFSRPTSRLGVGLFYDLGAGLDVYTGDTYVSLGMGLWLTVAGDRSAPFGGATVDEVGVE